jgi:hypothetical protein
VFQRPPTARFRKRSAFSRNRARTADSTRSRVGDSSLSTVSQMLRNTAVGLARMRSSVHRSLRAALECGEELRRLLGCTASAKSVESLTPGGLGSRELLKWRTLCGRTQTSLRRNWGQSERRPRWSAACLRNAGARKRVGRKGWTTQPDETQAPIDRARHHGIAAFDGSRKNLRQSSRRSS